MKGCRFSICSILSCSGFVDLLGRKMFLEVFFVCELLLFIMFVVLMGGKLILILING